MKTEYCYLIIDFEGSCWQIIDQGAEGASLPNLLAEVGDRSAKRRSRTRRDSRIF